jgi:hypothetical protein
VAQIAPGDIARHDGRALLRHPRNLVHAARDFQIGNSTEQDGGAVALRHHQRPHRVDIFGAPRAGAHPNVHLLVALLERGGHIAFDLGAHRVGNVFYRKAHRRHAHAVKFNIQFRVAKLER